MLAISPPAMKALPAPVNTMQRNPGLSFRFFTASRNASAIAVLMALSTSGRLNVRVATPVCSANAEIKGLSVIIVKSVAERSQIVVQLTIEQSLLVFMVGIGYFKSGQGNWPDVYVNNNNHNLPMCGE